MNNSYNDIRSLIPVEPIWWDEHAVPRYCKFTPLETANIYADEAALLLIECQNCGREFNVCLSAFSGWSRPGVTSIATAIQSAELHYGDPPNIYCCAAGPTMNSVPIRVVEYWRRALSTALGWTRVEELEINITPLWDQ